MQKIIVIVGPTASGKSDLAVAVAKAFDGEVISADSRQVYRGMNIGTGKVTKREMAGIPHYLLDVASPTRVFTAHDFVKKAQKAAADISKRKKLPIIAGGTGFYIDAFLGRIALGDAPANPKLRAELEQNSTQELLTLLKKHDKARAKDIISKNEQNNRVRLIRAIELALSSTARPRLTVKENYDVLWVGIKPDDVTLRARIQKRLLARMKRGMLAEVKRLHEHGVSWKRMEQLGLEYRYLARYLAGKIEKEAMLTELETKIWQYARRQKTYWRRNTDIQWVAPGEDKKVLTLVKNFLR